MSIVNFTFIINKSQSGPYQDRLAEGFLLVELAVALAVMAIFLIPLAYLHTEAMRLRVTAFKQSKAIAVARSFLERSKIEPSILKSGYTTFDDIKLTWKALSPPGLDNYAFIDLVVAYDSHELNLSTGILL